MSNIFESSGEQITIFYHGGQFRSNLDMIGPTTQDSFTFLAWHIFAEAQATWNMEPTIRYEPPFCWTKFFHRQTIYLVKFELALSTKQFTRKWNAPAFASGKIWGPWENKNTNLWNWIWLQNSLLAAAHLPAFLKPMVVLNRPPSPPQPHQRK